jgi:TRAP-type uncharacterized transport system fused permease subunit
VKTILKFWLVIAITITGLVGLCYTVVQQDIRLSANDPQIQMAEDAAARLADGQPLQSVVPAQKVDIATSLVPYMIVFDATGKTLASSALLDGQTPTIPPGITDYVRQNGEDRLTWQPEPGVRSAIVVTQFQGPTSGFVVVGRSLREVELLEDHILQLLMLGWVGMLFATFLATTIIFSILR